MRLPADKVKEAILHADQDVRDAAVYFFADSFSSDPAMMPLVIQAIDKFGKDGPALPTVFSAARSWVLRR